VPIARPRRVLESRRHPAFGPLLECVWTDLADEPVAARAGDGR